MKQFPWVGILALINIATIVLLAWLWVVCDTERGMRDLIQANMNERLKALEGK